MLTKVFHHLPFLRLCENFHDGRLVRSTCTRTSRAAPHPRPLSQKELRSRQFWRAMLAEFIATLVLVSTLLGSTVPVSTDKPVEPIYPAVAVGVVITAMVQCFGDISGAQVRCLQTL